MYTINVVSFPNSAVVSKWQVNIGLNLLTLLCIDKSIVLHGMMHVAGNKSMINCIFYWFIKASMPCYFWALIWKLLSGFCWWDKQFLKIFLRNQSNRNSVCVSSILEKLWPSCFSTGLLRAVSPHLLLCGSQGIFWHAERHTHTHINNIIVQHVPVCASALTGGILCFCEPLPKASLVSVKKTINQQQNAKCCCLFWKRQKLKCIYTFKYTLLLKQLWSDAVIVAEH